MLPLKRHKQHQHIDPSSSTAASVCLLQMAADAIAGQKLEGLTVACTAHVQARMGVAVKVLDPTPNCPAAVVAEQVVGSFRDPQAVRSLPGQYNFTHRIPIIPQAHQVRVQNGRENRGGGGGEGGGSFRCDLFPIQRGSTVIRLSKGQHTCKTELLVWS